MFQLTSRASFFPVSVWNIEIPTLCSNNLRPFKNNFYDLNFLEFQFSKEKKFRFSSKIFYFCFLILQNLPKIFPVSFGQLTNNAVGNGNGVASSLSPNPPAVIDQPHQLAHDSGILPTVTTE